MTPDPTTQPLYIPPAQRVSIDEIKQRATEVQNLAVVQAKEVVHEVYERDVTRAALAREGCAGRRVVLTVRLYPGQELAEVLTVRATGPPSGLPPRDAVARAAALAGSSPR